MKLSICIAVQGFMVAVVVFFGAMVIDTFKSTYRSDTRIDKVMAISGGFVFFSLLAAFSVTISIAIWGWYLYG